ANINVIVDDLVNPSPPMGFALEERGALFSRSKPDLVLALALIHHLVLTRSVPMEMLIGWMRGLCPKWVFEFAHEGDPMVEFLIKAKLGRTHPYSRGEFEAALSKSFRVLERLELGGADRTLYLAEGI
ncbi:MAG TPA: nodulation protein NoeA, partial [Nitrospinae bacterium]|nr:nodulation protein NoeA [Nitrospinota bacterium]